MKKILKKRSTQYQIVMDGSIPMRTLSEGSSGSMRSAFQGEGVEDMDNENDVQLPSNFWIGITVLLLWVWLVPGVRSLIDKYYDWTTFLLLGLSIVLVVVAIRFITLYKLESRKFERSRIMVTLGLFFAFSIYYLYELLKTRKSVAADTTFWRLHSLGALIFLGFVIWQIIVSLRARVSTEE